ncbi:hypothetical protein B0H17DRAFT_1219125 [Mycena rosella]|uniref:Uncharacterized protein n=1 Tax=Mycena rosella TaxID=1033263 RepID=A0AAD7BJB0_MYCRO|nr:hypothetical protein B0H17DRAFT_1219125 [Mycena rosella]
MSAPHAICARALQAHEADVRRPSSAAGSPFMCAPQAHEAEQRRRQFLHLCAAREEIHTRALPSLIPSFPPLPSSSPSPPLLSHYLLPIPLFPPTALTHRRYCLTHSPVLIIVVRPEHKVKKAAEKRRADPKRGTHFDMEGRVFSSLGGGVFGGKECFEADCFRSFSAPFVTTIDATIDYTTRLRDSTIPIHRLTDLAAPPAAIIDCTRPTDYAIRRSDYTRCPPVCIPPAHRRHPRARRH